MGDSTPLNSHAFKDGPIHRVISAQRSVEVLRLLSSKAQLAPLRTADGRRSTCSTNDLRSSIRTRRLWKMIDSSRR